VKFTISLECKTANLFVFYVRMGYDIVQSMEENRGKMRYV